MTRFGHVMRLTAACALSVCAGALFLVAPPVAQGKELAAAPTAQGGAEKKVHRLVLQVNTNDPAMMTLALNNATNVEQYYKNLGEKVEIEVVTFGPGLNDRAGRRARMPDNIVHLRGCPSVAAWTTRTTYWASSRVAGRTLEAILVF